MFGYVDSLQDGLGRTFATWTRRFAKNDGGEKNGRAREIIYGRGLFITCFSKYHPFLFSDEYHREDGTDRK